MITKEHLSAFVVIAVALLHHCSLAFEAPLVITAAYVGLLLVTLARRLSTVFHLALLMVIWRTLHFVVPDFLLGISAAYFALVFFLTVPIVKMREPSLLRWLQKGTIDRASVLWAIAISLCSAVALLLWAFWSDNLGVGEAMVAGMKHLPKPLILLLGVPLFALVNAFAEEAIYRGVFQQAALNAKFSPHVAVLLQASGFAAIHFSVGFPNGYTGYCMTFVYATALGLLRQRTGGILLPFLAHVLADLVIMYFLCFKVL